MIIFGKTACRSVFREAEEVAELADLQLDEVPGGEHVVEIVLVDPEQDRGHSTRKQATTRHYRCRSEMNARI